MVDHRDYAKRYPEGVDLGPNKPESVHSAILSKLLRYVKLYAEQSRVDFTLADEVQQYLTGYIRTDEIENRIKANDTRKPISIVIPTSFAVLDSLLATITPSLFNDMLFIYEGMGPEDVAKAFLMTQVIAYQFRRFKHGLALHTSVRDILVYGFGPLALSWERVNTRHKSKLLAGTSQIDDILSPGTPRVSYEGNVLYNIPPKNYICDPSVGLSEVQKGEFCGWFEYISKYDLLSKEITDEDLFNVSYALESFNDSQIYSIESNPNSIKVYHLYCKLLPSEWEMKGDVPEKWYFMFTDTHILRAQPLNFDHDMFPVVVGEPDFDGHGGTTTSRLGLIAELQNSINYLHNTRQASLRKGLNGKLIVDPEQIMLNDLNNPDPAHNIRMRPGAMNKDINKAIKQLQYTDVTQNFAVDLKFLSDVAMNVSGANDIVQGNPQAMPDRQTSASVNSLLQASMSRIGRLLSIYTQQVLFELGVMMASNTCQLMSQATYVKILGDFTTTIPKEYAIGDFALVSKDNIDAIYDLSINHTSSSGSVETWLKLFDIMTRAEPIGQEYDINRVFSHIARLLGVKDMRYFMKQPVADKEIPGMVASGEIQPINPSIASQMIGGGMLG